MSLLRRAKLPVMASLQKADRSMFVVISDLHFEEVASDRVSSPKSGRSLRFDDRNLSPGAFELVFRELASAAKGDGAKRLDLVLAGDIFDLHRTNRWFEDDLRPYLSCRDISAGSLVEAKVLRILDAISSEPAVLGSLQAIRRLARGYYKATEGPRAEHPVGVPTSVAF